MNDDIRALQRDLIEDMTEYLKGEDFDEDDEASSFDAGYGQEHIDRCAEILETLFEELSQIDGDDRDAEIQEIVKTTVLELNALNEETEGSLIETGQREQLCDIILLAAREAGLSTEESDITEEWREW